MRRQDEGVTGGPPWPANDGKGPIATAGMRTTFGTREQSSWIPDSDALPVARLRSAGAIIFGKTNMATAGIDVQTNNPVFGRTNNPWDLARSSGRLIRWFCRCHRRGAHWSRTWRRHWWIYSHPSALLRYLWPQALVPGCGRSTRSFTAPWLPAELDMAVPGPLARSANDLELSLDVIAGPEPSDAVGWRLTLPEPSKTCLTDYRIAAWLDDDDCPTEPDVLDALRGAIAALRGTGVTVHEHARPNFRLGDAFASINNFFATLCHGLPLAGSPFVSHLAPFATFVPGDSQLARVARGGSLATPNGSSPTRCAKSSATHGKTFSTTTTLYCVQQLLAWPSLTMIDSET